MSALPQDERRPYHLKSLIKMRSLRLFCLNEEIFGHKNIICFEIYISLFRSGLCHWRKTEDLHPRELPEVRPARPHPAHLRHHWGGHQGHPQGVGQRLQHHSERLLQCQMERPEVTSEQGLHQRRTPAKGNLNN